MIPELGHFALILALLLSGLQAVFGIAGASLARERWMAAVQPAVAGQFVMLAAAMGTLIAAFVTHDFSVKYVAENSNTALPLFYRIAALWGAHEGSLLLWIFILSVWTVAVALASGGLPRPFVARVLGVLGFVSFGFLLFTLATSNPFARLVPAAPDGRDLNPLLQDFALALHPPLLYTGYVGFAIAFAFACAAMLEGRVDQSWARWARPWTASAWAFLTIGISLGSWWAYYELGWGGFWFWDPVENASFMPWLVGAALLHSLAVTDKRGLFKSWTLLLAILAFSLSLLGTFLVRSGVLVSVHSFAADPARGIFILGFLITVIGGALALYAWRAPALGSQAGFELGAREAFLLFNNILLVIAAAVVFGGTMAPLVSDALGLGTLSVGPPYFEPTFLLPMLPLLALLAVGIHANWKRGRLGASRRRWLGAGVLALVLALAVSFGFYGSPGWLTLTGFALGIWILLSSLVEPINRLRRGLMLPRAVLGMTVAHAGLAVFVIGVTAVQSYSQERDVGLKPGEAVTLDRYEFRFGGVQPVEGPNYDGVRGQVTVTRDGHALVELTPEKRRYWVQRQVMTEASIDAGVRRDLFAALGEDLGANTWSIRVQVRPLIRFVWLGAYLMALGGFLAATDRRYRTARARVAEDTRAGAPTQTQVAASQA